MHLVSNFICCTAGDKRRPAAFSSSSSSYTLPFNKKCAIHKNNNDKNTRISSFYRDKERERERERERLTSSLSDPSSLGIIIAVYNNERYSMAVEYYGYGQNYAKMHLKFPITAIGFKAIFSNFIAFVTFLYPVFCGINILGRQV